MQQTARRKRQTRVVVEHKKTATRLQLQLQRRIREKPKRL